MRHRISAGTLTVRDKRILLVHHLRPGVHDFWVGPGGGVEGEETLAEAAQRETFEECGLTVRALRPAYIDDLVDDETRYLKVWFIAEYVSGELNTNDNPAAGESIVEAAWFDRDSLPRAHVFPEVLRHRFWDDLPGGFPSPQFMELRRALV